MKQAARRLLRRAARARARARTVRRRGVRRLEALVRELEPAVPGAARWREEFVQHCATLEARVEALAEELSVARDIYRGQRLALLNRRSQRRQAERAVRDGAELRVRVVPDEEVSVALTVSPMESP
jgi:hypothetical protein